MMKERFSKLLLGEDISGSGKKVCTNLAISNALTLKALFSNYIALSFGLSIEIKFLLVSSIPFLGN